jgi:nucleoside-diphosphate-sugar epimerase
MTSRRRVLVTGAGGFIGGRTVEILHASPGFEVVPSLRRWSTAARIGRLPLDPIRCDLLSEADVREAVTGIDQVVHCAVGDARATVQGTRNLLQAAHAAEVRRVVHLSTIDVYGRTEGTIDESAPVVRTGREYGDSKIEAEEVCREFVSKGLDVVILRPTIVYGPFSDLWTVEFAERFRSGSWMLPPDACQGRCNLVYVDDLVRAILLALDTPSDASGMAFNINGSDDLTWQEYFELFNASLELGPLPAPGTGKAKLSSALVAPIRSAAKGVFRRFEERIMAVYRRSRVARAAMKWTEGILRSVPSSSEFDLYGRQVVVSSARAEEILGYRPQVDAVRGTRLSAAWVRHEGGWDQGGC